MALTNVFDRYDFLTTIVPGAVFVFAMAILFFPTGVFAMDLTAETIFVIGVGIFLVGEVISMFADTADPGRQLFTSILLFKETRFELNEAEDSINTQLGYTLSDERQGNEDLRSTVARLTERRWEEVESWDQNRRHNWALAHVLSLVYDPAPFPTRNNTVFTLVKHRVTDPERWSTTLSVDVTDFEGNLPAETKNSHRVLLSPDTILPSGNLSDREEELRDWLSEFRYERGREGERWKIVNNSSKTPLSWVGRPHRFHEEQLLKWFTKELNDADGDPHVIEDWFDKELWDNFVAWANLIEIGQLLNKSPLTHFDRFMRAFSVILPGFTWFSNRMSLTDPVDWIDKHTIKNLRQDASIPSLLDRYLLMDSRIESPIKLVGSIFPPAEVSAYHFALYNRHVRHEFAERWYTDLFRMMFSMVETDLGPQANRFRSRSTFHRNISVTLGIVFLLFTTVAFLRIIGLLIGGVQNVIDSIESTLSIYISDFNKEYIYEIFDILTVSIDLFTVVGVVILVFVSLLWWYKYFQQLVKILRPFISQETGTRWWSIVDSAVYSLLIGLTISSIFSLVYVHLLTVSKFLATFWLLVICFLVSWSVFFANFSAFKVEWMINKPDDAGQVNELLSGVQIVSIPIIIMLSVLIIFILFPFQDQIGDVFAIADDLIIGLGWLVLGALSVVYFLPMFTVWQRRHEYEYLRYLMISYYLKYVGSNSEGGDSVGDQMGH